MDGHATTAAYQHTPTIGLAHASSRDPMHRLSVLLMTVLVVLAAPPGARGQARRLCFDTPAITNCIEGRFREYWEQNGGLPVFGYPITAAAQEQTAAGAVLTQHFERNRFELHPEQARPYDVQLGRLGDDELRRQGLQWQDFMDMERQDGCLWFAETRQAVCDAAAPFKSYWERHGLRTPALSPYQRSLALFGMPLSSPESETNAAGDTVVTQWFERARFEYHPNKLAGSRVLLGLLGVEGRAAPAHSSRTLPADTVWVQTLEKVRAMAPSAPVITLSKGLGLAQGDAAPDGSLLVYYQHGAVGQPGGKLWALDMRTGQRRLLADVPGSVFRTRFSPDSSRLAVVVQAPGSWQLMELDVRSGSVRVLQRGADQAFLAPIAWTRAGLLVTWLGFGDAPPEDLLLITPASGAMRTLYRGEHWSATISDDGQRIALTTGNPGMGGAQPEMSLAIVATATGRETILLSKAKQALGAIAWSPDNARLAYQAVDPGERAILHVVTPGGSDPQLLTFPMNSATGRLRDARWRDRSTLVLLTALGKETRVYQAPLNAFTTTSLKQIGAFAGGLEAPATLIYVPRP